MHHVFAELNTFTPVASSLLFVRCLIFVLQTNPHPAFKIPNLEFIIKLMLKYLFSALCQLLLKLFTCINSFFKLIVTLYTNFEDKEIKG